MKTLKPYVLGLLGSVLVLPVAFTQGVSEAPAGFDGLTNGMVIVRVLHTYSIARTSSWYPTAPI